MNKVRECQVYLRDFDEEAERRPSWSCWVSLDRQINCGRVGTAELAGSSHRSRNEALSFPVCKLIKRDFIILENNYLNYLLVQRLRQLNGNRMTERKCFEFHFQTNITNSKAGTNSVFNLRAICSTFVKLDGCLKCGTYLTLTRDPPIDLRNVFSRKTDGWLQAIITDILRVVGRISCKSLQEEYLCKVKLAGIRNVDNLAGHPFFFHPLFSISWSNHHL